MYGFLKVVDIKLAAYTQSWTLLFILALIIPSLAFYFAYILISSEIESLQVYSTAFMLYSSPSFYFMMFLTVGLVFFFDLLVIYIKQNYKGGAVEKGRRLMKMNNLEDETVQREIVEEMFESRRGYLKMEKERDDNILTEEIPFNKV